MIGMEPGPGGGGASDRSGTQTRPSVPPETDRVQKRDLAYLVVLAGVSAGEMFKITAERTVIGRGPKVTLRLNDDGVSREHCEIVVEGQRVVLRDLGSTNGTFCNGVRVDRRELTDGDKIMVGSTSILKFTYHDYLDEVFQRQMYESALRDGLTKVFNRRYFTDHLEKEFAYAVRHETPLALIFIDIDHFKQINDTHGHPAGDAVLADLSALLTTLLRTEDVLARFGGEEFAVLCRGTDLPSCEIVAERLRSAVERRAFEASGTRVPVTISVGIAAVPNPAIKDYGEFLAAADQAMYQAKRSGRNRVCSRSDEAPTPTPTATSRGR
jgi:diguanylate cyclase (GGDEF)-like protein